MDTEDQVWLIILQNLGKVTASQNDPAAVYNPQKFDNQVIWMVEPGRVLLNEVVEMDAKANEDRRILQHAFDSDLD